jgi:hypothetical protein
MSEKFFIFTLEKDNELFKFIDDDQKNSFENKHFIKIDDHVLFIHSLDLDSEIKHPKLRDDLAREITNATSCYVSLHRGSKENVKNSQRQIFPQDKTIFIEEHHNSGFIYEKLIEYVKAEKDDEKKKIRNDIKEYFELNKTIRENWEKLSNDLKNYIIDNNAKINPSSNFIFVLAELSPDLFGENFNEEWTEKNPAEFYGVDLLYKLIQIFQKKEKPLIVNPFLILSTVDKEKIEKYNKLASWGFLKIPQIGFIKIEANSKKEHIEEFSKGIPLMTELKLFDIVRSFDFISGTLDEILHPLSEPNLTDEKRKEIFNKLIDYCKLKKVEITNEDEKNILEKVSKGEIDTLREYILEKIKSEKNKPWEIPEDNLSNRIKNTKIVIIEDVKETGEYIRDNLKKAGFKNISLILKFQDVEKIINSEIITASIFIIDYRLLDENGNWWPYQGYEIIQKIAAKKPSARFFILSGKDEEFLLYIPSHISTKVFSFSKDLILKDQSKFDLFAKEIYDQIYTLILSSDFINKLKERIFKRKNESILKKLIKDCNDKLSLQFDQSDEKKIQKFLKKSEINCIKDYIINKIGNKNPKIRAQVENILKLIEEELLNEIFKKFTELDNQKIQEAVFNNFNPDGSLNLKFSPYKGEPNFDDNDSIEKWVITRSIIMCYSDYLEYVQGISNYEEKLNRIARDIMLRGEGESSEINNQKKMINSKLYLTEDSFKFEEGYMLPVEQRIRKIFISRFMESYIIKKINEFKIKEELSELKEKIERIGPDIIKMCENIKNLNADGLIKNSINKFLTHFKSKKFEQFWKELGELVDLLESLLNFLNIKSIIIGKKLEIIKNLDGAIVYDYSEKCYNIPNEKKGIISTPIYTKKSEEMIKITIKEMIKDYIEATPDTETDIMNFSMDIIQGFPEELHGKPLVTYDDEKNLNEKPRHKSSTFNNDQPEDNLDF